MPEDKPLSQVPDLETQIAELRQRLTGHQIFARRRGKSRILTALLEEMLKGRDSPSAALRAWDALLADGRVLLSLMAQLERDGRSTSVEELTEALRDPSFFFTGETVPIEQTTPLTVVMPDPERTLLMVEWVLRNRDPDNLFAHLDGYTDDQGFCNNAGCDCDLTERLIAAFPSMKEVAEELSNRATVAGEVIALAHIKEVTCSLPIIDGIPLSLAPNRDQGNQMIFAGRHDECWLKGHWRQPGYLAYVVPGEQQAVLRQFDRQTQKRLATWQLRLPTVRWERMQLIDPADGPPPYYLWVVPETEHKDNQRRYPAYSSPGCSHGFGLLWEAGHAFTVPGQLSQEQSFHCLLCSN